LKTVQDAFFHFFSMLLIVSLQLAVSQIFSSDFKVCFHILQSTSWLIWILSYLTLFLAFQIDHLDIKMNVFNRSSNIIYTESRLRKMNLSNWRCHLCKESNIQEDLQYLFIKCIISNRFISNITILINTSNVGTVNLNEKNMMFGFNMGLYRHFMIAST
jgi:hypothetical protein